MPSPYSSRYQVPTETNTGTPKEKCTCSLDRPYRSLANHPRHRIKENGEQRRILYYRPAKYPFLSFFFLK
jgi:hypothetical protein